MVCKKWFHALTILSFLFIASCMITTIAFADVPAAKEDGVDIPAVVNADEDLGLTDADIDEIIRQANEDMPPGFRLVRSGDPNYQQLGDDGGMTLDDRNQAREDGEEELPDDGKGVKIDLVENADANDLNVNGVAVHRTPVIIVEVDSDPNVTGNTVAHEWGHVNTLCGDPGDPNDQGHSVDPNNAMYPYTTKPDGSVRGNNWDPNQIKEITPSARASGTVRFTMPVVPPGGAVAVPGDIDYAVNAYGGKRDPLYDMFSPSPAFDPRLPLVGYADIRTITLYCDRPDMPDSTTNLRIRVNGRYQVDSFFDIMYSIQLNKDIDPAIDAEITIHVFFDEAIMQVHAQAFYRDLETGLDEILPDPDVLFNKEVDANATAPFINSALELQIPTEKIANDFFGPGSDPFDGAVAMVTSTLFMDMMLPPDWFPVIDEVAPFNFALTRPVTEQGMKFIQLEDGGGGGMGNVAVYCWGFEDVPFVNVKVNGLTAGEPVAVKSDGTAMFILPSQAYETPNGAVIDIAGRPLDQKVDTLVTGYLQLQNCPGGQLDSDLNGDCVTNLFDFVEFAQDWLLDYSI